MAIASGTCGTCSWNIDDNGKLTIKPTSGSAGELLNNTQIMPTYEWPWLEYAEHIMTAAISGTITTRYAFIGSSTYGKYDYFFYHAKNLIQVTGLGCLTGATSLRSFFFSCESLQSIDIQNMNTTGVAAFDYMFYRCESLTSLNLSNFDTRNVVFNGSNGLYYLIYGCDLLSEITFGSNFYVKPYSQYDGYTNASDLYFNGGRNTTNGIIVTSDEAFSELTNARRAGTWTRGVSQTYTVTAVRTTNGAVDEDGENATFTIRWATDATTTTRTLTIYQKEAGASSYPSTATLTQTLSGDSGVTTVTINSIGDAAYDFRVEFYDGTNTFIAFPSIQSNIRLITIDETGNVCLALDTSAASGTVDAALYDAIRALGWEDDVII